MNHAATDMEAMIRGTGLFATVYRPGADVQRFGGSVEGPLVRGDSIPVSLGYLAPKEAVETGNDAKASVLPTADVLEDDFLDISGTRFRVVDCLPIYMEGTVINQKLALRRERVSS